MCAASTAIPAVQRMFLPLFLKHVVPLCVVQLRSVHVSTWLLFSTFIHSKLKLKPHTLIFRVFLPNAIIHYGFPRSNLLSQKVKLFSVPMSWDYKFLKLFSVPRLWNSSKSVHMIFSVNVSTGLLFRNFIYSKFLIYNHTRRYFVFFYQMALYNTDSLVAQFTISKSAAVFSTNVTRRQIFEAVFSTRS